MQEKLYCEKAGGRYEAYTYSDGLGRTIPAAICIAVAKIARIREATDQTVRFVGEHIE